MSDQNAVKEISERIASIDYFRGFTMFLLIGEFTGLFNVLHSEEFRGGVLYSISRQLHHHPWHGLRFWDLVQPFFMFIVGLSMPLSFGKRTKRGDSQREIVYHVLKRSFLLIFLGWALYCIGPGKITFQFQNVLAQIGVTYLIAFAIMKRPARFQLVFSILLLVLMDLAYRFFPVEGFNQAFTPDKNLGAWVDMKINGELSGGHWVSLNAVITSAHTIWGVLCGYLLISERKAKSKIQILVIAGVACLLSGYLLDPVTPIIKRISTSSFVLVSGGYSIIALAFLYYLIDVRKWNPGTRFFAVVGMNPLFIYLFAHVGGAMLVYSIFIPFTSALFSFAGKTMIDIFTMSMVWFALWYICYFMYKKKIFIRI